MNFSRQYKNWMMLPALVWLFTQFAMSGAMASPASATIQATLCTPFGSQQVMIDLETGQPVKQAMSQGCEWCQSFGVAVEVIPLSGAVLHYITWAKEITPKPKAINITALWQVSGFQSRAPPL